MNGKPVTPAAPAANADFSQVRLEMDTIHLSRHKHEQASTEQLWASTAEAFSSGVVLPRGIAYLPVLFRTNWDRRFTTITCSTKLNLDPNLLLGLARLKKHKRSLLTASDQSSDNR